MLASASENGIEDVTEVKRAEKRSREAAALENAVDLAGADDPVRFGTSSFPLCSQEPVLTPGAPVASLPIKREIEETFAITEERSGRELQGALPTPVQAVQLATAVQAAQLPPIKCQLDANNSTPAARWHPYGTNALLNDHASAAPVQQPTSLRAEELKPARTPAAKKARGAVSPAVFAGFVPLHFSSPVDCAVHSTSIHSTSKLDAVIKAVRRAELSCEEHDGLELLDGVKRLAAAVHGNAGDRQLVVIEWQPLLPWKVTGGTTPVEARLNIWLCDKIFDMRSDYDIWLLMDRLRPVRAVAPLPAAPPRHELPRTDNSYAFTLAGLMRAMESAGYDEAEQPSSLHVNLFHFQRQSLQWMIDRERLPGGLNSLFWAEYKLLDGSKSYFYNPTCGEFMSARHTLVDGRPPLASGGFLCEEMGLGKTVEMLSLVLANPFEQRTSRARLKPGEERIASKATLVVVPLSLLDQWTAEIAKCVERRRLRVAVWHGESRYTDTEHSIHLRDSRHATLDISVKPGASSGDMPASTFKVLVNAVAPGSSAESAGEDVTLSDALQIGDTILTINGQRVDGGQRLPALASGPPETLAARQQAMFVARQRWMADSMKRCQLLLRQASSNGSMTMEVVRPPKGAEALAECDVVLTTYDMLQAETRARSKTLHEVHWWRVVLDESQKVQTPSTVIARSCVELSRVHSWLMSGTPVGNVVEDLLGQLLFLGVEPYCRMGKDVDNFWEREITGRFRAKDKEALEIVHELLSQIMMRHSKGQTLTNADGRAEKIVSLPAMHTEEVLVELRDPSERAVYLTMEATAQAEFYRLTSQPNPMRHYLTLLSLASTLRGTATHASLIKLDVLHDRLQRNANSDSFSTHHMAGSGLDGAARQLRKVIAELPPQKPGLPKLAGLLADVTSHRCAVCMCSTAAIEKPVLLACCLEVMCRDCATVGLDEGFSPLCPQCQCANDADSFTCLTTPIDAPIKSSPVDTNSPPSAAAALAALSVPPTVDRLGELRHWVCNGAPCPDGNISRRPCPYEVDGLHFCSQGCAKATLQKALVRTLNPHALSYNISYELCAPGDGRAGGVWPGSMAPARFANMAEAYAALARVTKQVVWEGLSLYPDGATTRTDVLYPLLTHFGPPAAPPSSFLAHYDAAGGERPYGVHPHGGFHLGSKLTAVVDAVIAMCEARPCTDGGCENSSKCVIFSAAAATLSLLHEALKSKYGGAALAQVVGTCSAAERAAALKRFRTSSECFVLLLSVGSCAAGLTLTAADHCFLVDLQPNAGKELQLVNRIYRIGQTRDVIVKKFIVANTIEERLLHQRKQSNGLLVSDGGDGDDDEADAMAVPSITTDEEAQEADEDSTGSAQLASAARLSDLRSLFGL